MITSLTLPPWLDKLLFQEMGAHYCCSNKDMTVIDWDKTDLKNYLGTYFPRSFTEAYCIFDEIFTSLPDKCSVKETLSIFDFGCGTGGEIIGLAFALSKHFSNLKELNIKGFDGNYHALRMLENIIKETSKHISVNLNFKAIALKIDDLYDMQIIDRVLTDKYDIIMSFKAICEFVTKKQLEEQNPYKYLSPLLKNKLNENGLLLLEDVTTYNNTSREWLPKMMEQGLKEANCNIQYRNEGFNQCFLISHSHKKNDKSKIAWRAILK